MKKVILLIMTSMCVYSCTDKKTKVLETMREKIEDQMNDLAFKENATLTIIELKAIDYDTVTENDLDTLRLVNINYKFQYFQNLFDKNLELAKLKIQSAKLSKSIGSQTLTDINKEDAQKYVDEADKYQDSIKYYHKLDSTIRLQIQQRTLQKDFYKGKFFFKATLEKDKNKNNILDTMYFYFDQDLNLIKDL